MIKSILSFKQQENGFIRATRTNENRAVKGLVLATATATPTIKATYTNKRGLAIERVLFIDEVLK